MDLTSILLFVAVIVLFYFMMIRPQQRKIKEQQERVARLQPGTRIMTASGIYGTIRHIGQQQAVVEIAPGVEMTLLKAAITKVVAPNEDEFEYEDDEAEQDAEAVEDDQAQAVAEDDGFDQAIAGFHADSAPDPQTKDDQDGQTPGETHPGNTR